MKHVPSQQLQQLSARGRGFGRGRGVRGRGRGASGRGRGRGHQRACVQRPVQAPVSALRAKFDAFGASRQQSEQQWRQRAQQREQRRSAVLSEAEAARGLCSLMVACDSDEVPLLRVSDACSHAPSACVECLSQSFSYDVQHLQRVAQCPAPGCAAMARYALAAALLSEDCLALHQALMSRAQLQSGQLCAPPSLSGVPPPSSAMQVRRLVPCSNPSCSEVRECGALVKMSCAQCASLSCALHSCVAFSRPVMMSFPDEVDSDQSGGAAASSSAQWSGGKMRCYRRVSLVCAEERAMLSNAYVQWRLSLVDEALRAQRWQEYVADERWKEQHCRLCPHCSRVFHRVMGCNHMVCGRSADAGAQRGCGRQFDFSSAPQYRARLDDNPLSAALARQSQRQCSLCHQMRAEPSMRCVQCSAQDSQHVVCDHCFFEAAQLGACERHVFERVQGHEQ